MSGSAPPPIPVQPVIELREASKWYGDVIGVNQVTLSIGPGVTGLLGPNGAGKSTLLRLMTGQLYPGKGTVTIFGESPWQNAEVFRRIGFCPDTESFYEEMTALEFVTLMGRLSDLSAPESRRRASEQLERVGLGPHARRRLKGYSKGMRQRTKLASALLLDPEVLLLDEPLNGLDPEGRIHMLELFRELGATGKTVLVSSHILHEVENLTRRIALIHRGRVVADGEIEEIRALIENQPLTLRITSDQPRRVGQHLAGAESVASLTFGDDSAVIVRTRHPEQVYHIVQNAVVEGRFNVSGLTALDENLDAIFQYLVKP